MANKDKKCTNRLDSIDLYGGQPNQFTIKGRTNIYSFCGVGCSIIHIILVILFAILKLTFVVTKFNPAVSVFEKAEQHQTEEEGINLD
jgi:uncharacterized membrane protein